MESQESSAQPIPPVQTPAALPKPAFPWGIAVILIVVIGLTASITLFLTKGFSPFFLSQTQPSPSLVKSPQLTPAAPVSTPTPAAALPASTPSCDVSDSAFCKVLADLKSALAASNYAGFLAYQNLQSVTCDPDGMFVAICEGEAKGAVKQGYGIGWNQSEGTMVDKNGYTTSVSGYVKSNGPFIYRGSLVSADKGVAVFLNAKKDYLLVFPLKRTGGSWRMNTLLLGGTFGDKALETLSNSLFNLVP